jgi:hypothetical protein
MLSILYSDIKTIQFLIDCDIDLYQKDSMNMYTAFDFVKETKSKDLIALFESKKENENRILLKQIMFGYKNEDKYNLENCHNIFKKLFKGCDYSKILKEKVNIVF